MKYLPLMLMLPLTAQLAACGWLPTRPDSSPLRAQAPLANTTGTASGEWPAANWWQKYADPTLDALINQALATSPSLAATEARFQTARESVRISAAANGLHVNANASIARQRLSDNGLFPTALLGFHWYNQADLGLQASYSFDFWHKQRSYIAAAIDDMRAAQAERSAAALALSAAIADSYFGWQADQAQAQLVSAQIALAERRREIAQSRINAQLDPADDLHSVSSELAGLRETAVTLQYSADLRRVVIAALLGISPDALPTLTAHPLPTVNAQLPNNVHIDLLARRADISASRWQVEAAQQRLGAARAEFLPDISLNALAGLSSIDLAKLFNAGSAVPAASAAVHLPIFDSGLLRAQFGARAAQVEAAVANYNETVMTAAREVATQTLRLQQLAAQRSERESQSAAVEQLLDNATARNRQGLTDARQKLMTNQALQQQHAALISLDAAAVSADINLTLALGGGYQASVNDPIQDTPLQQP